MIRRCIGKLYIGNGEEKRKKGKNVIEPIDKGVWDSTFRKEFSDDGELLAWIIHIKVPSARRFKHIYVVQFTFVSLVVFGEQVVPYDFCYNFINKNLIFAGKN